MSDNSNESGQTHPDLLATYKYWTTGLSKKVKKPVSPDALVPITEAYWASLDGKAKWDSLVALRGPDLVSSDVLKWFTSSVLRHVMKEVMRVGGLVNGKVPFVVLPNSYAGWKGNFDICHFCGHVYEAACWLKVPIVYIGEVDFQTIMTTNCHPYEAELELYKVLPSPYKETLGKVIEGRGNVVPGSGASCPE